MATVNVYLTFKGNCEEAFDFYKSVFGGEFPYVGRFKDMPPSEESGSTMPAEFGNRIMHISLPIGGGTAIMGSDTGGEWAAHYQPGNNFSISINADSKEEADRIFNGLSTGGNVTMPMNKTFWGDYFGMWTDKFGINWMMSFNENQQK
ncbi:MAG: VOC family protein [Taibaiella sp.]|nr:VOC family protein [Taibaiella sp.]